jgi:GNAT superfamily N-acetyltransferase
LLWKHAEPIGICVFAAPVATLSRRNRFFGLSGRMNGDTLTALTKNIWVLARVVIHPTYRGAGLAPVFVRRACELCPVPWIEALAAMGRANPFFEKASFVNVGVIRKPMASFRTRGGSRRHDAFREPVYYVFDNRGSKNN